MKKVTRMRIEVTRVTPNEFSLFLQPNALFWIGWCTQLCLWSTESLSLTTRIDLHATLSSNLKQKVVVYLIEMANDLISISLKKVWYYDLLQRINPQNQLAIITTCMETQATLTCIKQNDVQASLSWDESGAPNRLSASNLPISTPFSCGSCMSF